MVMEESPDHEMGHVIMTIYVHSCPFMTFGFELFELPKPGEKASCQDELLCFNGDPLELKSFQFAPGRRHLKVGHTTYRRA